MAIIWAFIYSNLFGNSIGLNICGMWDTRQIGLFFQKNNFSDEDYYPQSQTWRKIGCYRKKNRCDRHYYDQTSSWT